MALKRKVAAVHAAAAEAATEMDLLDVGGADYQTLAVPLKWGSAGGKKKKAPAAVSDDDDEDEDDGFGDDDNDDDDDDDDDDENGEVNVTDVKTKEGQYHSEMLLKHLEELKGADNVPWIETLEVVGTQTTDVPNVDDDFQRELAFYKQGLEAAILGRERVLAAGVKFDRPNDYFAEMLKTDAHMQKVRQHLADEAQQIKRSEEAAKQRSMKKYGKQVQAEKLQERAKQKSKQLDKIKMVRKGRANVESALDDDFDINVEDSEPESGSSRKAGKKPFAGAAGGKKPFDKKPFDKKPFDKKPFDKKPFDKKPFEKKSFDKKPFEKKSFGGPNGGASGGAPKFGGKRPDAFKRGGRPAGKKGGAGGGKKRPGKNARQRKSNQSR